MEASRGAEARMCDCKRNRLWIQFSVKEIKYIIKFLW